ncbi:MAG: hypothetical protein KGJ05_04980 [Alphaproteobacteria bacterium]|nr:hypothetical protein [Alphaproteobacteria bacterium]MDE2341684.1 hypothetical protein [Alphaproteobacteria bacterium]
MSWKDNIQVRDLDAQDLIELSCRRCRTVRYVDAATLHARKGADRLTLAEVEQRARCRQRGCNGAMRMAMPHRTETKGFVGGLA